MRLAPDIKVSERLFNSELIGRGFDTIKETYNLLLHDQTQASLYRLKLDFQDRNEGQGKSQGFTIVFGGLEFQLDPWGAKGTPFILRSDLFTIEIRNKKSWDFSVTYTAACLWQHGYIEAQQMILQALSKEATPICGEGEGVEAWQRISVAHYALDVYSPDLTREFGFHFPEQFICHSSAKARVDFENKGYVMGTSVRCQTFTIGSKAGLQIQLYDKIAEIKEASGKTWMYKVWEQEGFHPTEEQKKDVWRLEIRMGKNFLRGNSGRSIETPEQLLENLERLLSEALITRRLVEPVGGDTNKRRWPMHPFWYQMLEAVGERRDMLPIGKQVEQAGAVLVEKMKQDLKSIARRYCTLSTGDFDELDAEEFFKQALAEVLRDEDHEDRMLYYEEKYKYTDCPR